MTDQPTDAPQEEISATPEEPVVPPDAVPEDGDDEPEAEPEHETKDAHAADTA